MLNALLQNKSLEMFGFTKYPYYLWQVNYDKTKNEQDEKDRMEQKAETAKGRNPERKKGAQSQH